MAILANPDHFEMDHDGEIEQELVAVKYVGTDRRYSNRSAATQGLWPDYTSFSRDVWYVAFVPESVPEGVSASGMAWFERNADFEVVYDPERIAGILLDRNYVSLEPAGPIGERDTLPGFWDRLHEALGIEDPAEAGARYEEQLRELAGRDDPDDDVETVATAKDLVDSFTRAELKEGVKAVRVDASEFSLRGTTMDEMADYLVESTDDAAATVREANL